MHTPISALFRAAILLTAGLLAAPIVWAQQKPAPAEERSPGQAPTQLLQQQRVTAAYRELQKARSDLRFIEQDYLNAVDDDKIARGRAQAAAEALAKATKVRDEAKAKEAAARKRYDDALNQ